jgi:hypothetical protein
MNRWILLGLTMGPVVAGGATACSSGASSGASQVASSAAALDEQKQDAGSGREWEPPSPQIDAVTSTLAVVAGTPTMLDVGQSSQTKMTLEATWSPSSTKGGNAATGELAFRAAASSSPLVGYVLTIDPEGHLSLYVNQLSEGGVFDSTLLAGGADAGDVLTSSGGTFALQLVASGDKFTVADANDGNTVVLSYTDKNMGSYWVPADDPNGWAYTQAPAVWVGAETGSGDWQLTVHQQNAGALPPLGAAAVVLPVTDQDNTTELVPGVPDILVNHFDISQPGSCEIDFDVSSMVVQAGQKLGHVTIHREDLTGQDESGASDYSVQIFQDQIQINKQYLGTGSTLMTQSLKKIIPGGLVPGMQLPLQIAAYDHDGAVTINVNLTDMNELLDGGGTDLTPQTNPEQLFDGGVATVDGKMFPQDATYVHLVKNIMSYTDTGGDEWPVFSFGVRFGLYTAQNQFNCWDDLALIPHP